MAEIEIDGHVYALANLDPMTQFHVTRRLGPVMASLRVDEGANIMTGVFSAIGALSDADAEYVIGKCLGDCRRKNGETWAKVYTAGRLMFDDIGMAGMIRLTFETIRENMSGFFSGPSLASQSGQS